MSNELQAAYAIEVEQFSFPEWLDDDNANFRLQVDLRYRKTNGDFATKTAIMPGVDSYWECSEAENKKQAKRDQDQQKKQNYKRICVRKRDKNGMSYMHEVEMNKIAPWGKVFRVNTQHLYELRVIVFDVDRADWFEKLAGVLSSFVSAVPVMGDVLEPLAEGLGSKLAGGDDKKLFVGFGVFSDPACEIAGNGFSLRFVATKI